MESAPDTQQATAGREDRVRAPGLRESHPKLGEVLVACQYISSQELEFLLTFKPAGMRMGEHLIQQGKLTEETLYEALSLQQNLPLGKPEPDSISRPVTRSLPAGAEQNDPAPCVGYTSTASGTRAPIITSR